MPFQLHFQIMNEQQMEVIFSFHAILFLNWPDQYASETFSMPDTNSAMPKMYQNGPYFLDYSNFAVIHDLLLKRYAISYSTIML